MNKTGHSAGKGLQPDSGRLLREYQQRITDILESFTDAFFEVDHQWVITYWNKEAERLLNQPRLAVIGRNLWEVYPEAVSLKFYNEYYKAIKTKKAVRFEEYFAPLNLWLEVAAFPSGEGLSVYFKDITSRVQATSLLESEKRKYEDLFNFSPIPQWVYDLDTLDFLHVNEAAITHYGYSRKEFLAMTIKEIRPDEDLEILEEIIGSKIVAGKYNQSTVKHRKKNGEIILVVVEGNTVTFEGKNARLVIAIDQTQKIKAEQRSRQLIDQYNIVSKATSDVVWDWNITTAIITYNKGLKAIFGHNNSSANLNWWDSHVHPDDLQRVHQQFDELIRYKKSKQVVEYRFRCADGTYKNVLDRSFIIFNDEGEAIRVIGSMQDISEKEKYVQAIEMQNRKLKEITWMQSHNLRAPVAKILGLSSLMSIEGNNTDELIEYSKLIHASVNELDNVLRSIIRKGN